MNSALPTDTDEIRRAMEQYDAQELRKELYEVAAEKRENSEARLAIKLVLTGWNWRAYAGTDITNTDLDEQVEGLIERTESLTEYIDEHDHTLGSSRFCFRGLAFTPGFDG